MRAHLPFSGLLAVVSAATVLLLTACGEGPAGTVARERFEGRFAAFAGGRRLDFTLTEQGSEVRVLSTGTPAVGRRTAPGLVTGRLQDAAGESEFELEMKQGRLAVRFVVIAGDGSRERLPEVLLERLPDDLETAPRDPALVGAWVDREVGSAAASGAPVTRLELRADGSYDLRRDAQDAEAFGALARRHANLVLDVALRTSGDRDVAEDALQDAFVALARDGSLRPAEVGVRAWLARTAILAARHRAASERARTRRERVVGASRGGAVVDTRDDEAAAVRAALARVDGEDAAVLTLRYLHGLAYPELAAVLDVAEPTARVRVHRAMERLRDAAGARDADDDRLAAVLATVPTATAATAVVDGAIAAATVMTAATTTGTVVAVVAPAARSFARLPTWGPWVAAAAMAVGIGSTWVVRGRVRDGDLPVAPEGPSAAREGTEASAAPLAGRPRSSGGSRPAPDDAAALPVAPTRPPPPAPVPRAGADDVPTRRRVEFRLELDSTKDGVAPPLRITALECELDEAPVFERTATGVVADLVDGAVTLTTDDPRTAVSTIRTWVRPGATEVVVRLPSVDDPRLATLALRVVDAKTRAPLREAELEWLPGRGPAGVVRGDAEGRLLATLGERTGALEAFRVWKWSATIRAPGHRAWTPGPPPIGPDAGAAAAFSDRALAQLLANGGYTIGLDPHAAPESVARRLRFEDASGAPVVGAYVFVAFPPPRALAAAVTPQDVGDGFRRTDARGEIELTFASTVAVELRMGDAALAAWGLAAEAWPATGPRVVEVPRWADVEVEFEGVPARTGLGWSADDARDELGAARTSADGPAVAPTLDEAFRVRCEAGDLVFPFVEVGRVVGRVDGPDASTVRLPVVVGTTTSLVVRAEDARSATVDPDRARRVELRPAAAGPLRLTLRWDDLPRPP